MLIEILVG